VHAHSNHTRVARRRPAVTVLWRSCYRPSELPQVPFGGGLRCRCCSSKCRRRNCSSACIRRRMSASGSDSVVLRQVPVGSVAACTLFPSGVQLASSERVDLTETVLGKLFVSGMVCANRVQTNQRIIFKFDSFVFFAFSQHHNTHSLSFFCAGLLCMFRHICVLFCVT
jgi:hypothetical protein